jgi:hypothetical protein
MGERGMPIGFWWEKQKGRDVQEDLDVRGEYIKTNLTKVG